MRIVVIDVQSTLVASAFERILVQETADCRPVISETPEKTVEQCRLFKPDVLLMEVTGYTPWMLEERLKTSAAVKKMLPMCRVVLSVDENADGALAERVKQCKIDGDIDAFVFNSVGERYFAALIDSV